MGKVPENSIHVTGFGPFRNFTKSNPSWEAVSLLPNNIVHSGQSIPIVKHEIPVTYAAVDQKVQEIWSSKPKLVVHCGVSRVAKKVCLEQNAFNGNFREADFAGQMPCSHNITLPNAGAECRTLCTSLNLENIINEIGGSEVMKCSNHPGDYLCGYIYLKSLDMDRTRSLFIHVPPTSEYLTTTHLKDNILSIIKQCIRQIDEEDQ